MKNYLRLLIFSMLLVATTSNVFAQKLKTQQLILENSIPNTVTLQPPVTGFTNYSLAFPGAGPSLNQVLTATSLSPSISTSWSSIGSLLKAANGLTMNGDSVELGGLLYKSTIIDLSSFNLSLSGSGGFNVQNTGGLRLGTGTPIYTGAAISTGTSGQILKSAGNAASPEWVNVGSIVKAANGLSMNGDSVELGGLLYKSTTVSTGPLTGLTVDGGGAITISSTGNGANAGGLVLGPNTELNTGGSNGTLGQILRSSGDGTSPSWVNVGSLIKAANGLSMNGDSVELGGTLYKNTLVGMSTFDLRLGSAADAGNVILGNAAGDVIVSKFATKGIVKNSATGVLSTGRIDLADSTNDVSGILKIGNGGTNSTTVGAAGTVAYSDGTSYNFTSVGTSGQILKSNASGAPTWVNVGSLVKAANGLNMNGDSVELGGTLYKTTTIANGGFDLNLTGAGALSLGATTPLKTGATNTSGTLNQLLVSQGNAASPEWSSNLTGLTLNNTTLTGTTNITGGALNISTTTMTVSDTTTTTWNGDITYGPSSTVIFNSTNPVYFDTLPSMPLNHNNILVGNVSNVATPLAGGTPGQILSITDPAGNVAWQGVGSLVKTANGLSKSLGGDSVELGGTLYKSTAVANAGFDLTISGSGEMNIQTGGLNLGTAGPGAVTPLNTRGSDGADSSILVSRGPNVSPEWKSISSIFINGHVACTGLLTQTISGLPASVTASSNVIVTYEDTGASAPVVAMMVSGKGSGTFTVTFTGAPSSTTGFINYIVLP